MLFFSFAAAATTVLPGLVAEEMCSAKAAPARPFLPPKAASAAAGRLPASVETCCVTVAAELFSFSVEGAPGSPEATGLAAATSFVGAGLPAPLGPPLSAGRWLTDAVPPAGFICDTAGREDGLVCGRSARCGETCVVWLFRSCID